MTDRATPVAPGPSGARASTLLLGVRQLAGLVLAGLLFALAAPGSARALDLCSGANSVDGHDGFVIFLDDIGLPAAYSDSAGLNEALYWKLAQRLNWSTPSLAGTVVVHCRGRSPASSQDLTALADDLSRANVVLEIWGSYLPDGTGLNFAVYPVMSSAAHGWPNRLAGDRVLHEQYENLGGVSEETYLASLIESSPHIPAYAEIAVASQAFIQRDYDGALGHFCRATALLNLIPLERNATTPVPLLRAFVAAMTQHTVESAVAARNRPPPDTADPAAAPQYTGMIGTSEIPADAPCGLVLW